MIDHLIALTNRALPFQGDTRIVHRDHMLEQGRADIAELDIRLEFLSKEADSSGYGYGSGDGDGYGYGYGSGDGDGYGYGSGSGDGDGYGYGSDDGSDDGDGYGDPRRSIGAAP